MGSLIRKLNCSTRKLKEELKEQIHHSPKLCITPMRGGRSPETSSLIWLTITAFDKPTDATGSQAHVVCRLLQGQLMKAIPIGSKGTAGLLVTPAHLANQVKDVTLPPVLATPVMILIWRTPR